MFHWAKLLLFGSNVDWLHSTASPGLHLNEATDPSILFISKSYMSLLVYSGHENVVGPWLSIGVVFRKSKGKLQEVAACDWFIVGNTGVVLCIWEDSNNERTSGGKSLLFSSIFPFNKPDSETSGALEIVIFLNSALVELKSIRFSAEYCGMLEESKGTSFAWMSPKNEESLPGIEELHKEEGWYVFCS